MASKQLRATETLVDGSEGLKIETRHEFDETEAAIGLALVYADEPLRSGPDKLRAGLRMVAEAGYRRTRPDGLAEAHPTAVEAYRTRITSQPQVMFPEPKLRARMFEELRGAQAAWRQADPATRGTNLAPGLKLPILWAKHNRTDADGVDLDPVVPVVHLQLDHFYRLDTAAFGLALVHRTDLVPRSKADVVPQADYILREQLRQAAGPWLKAARTARLPKVDPDLVAAYRAMLLETGVFTVG